MTMLIRNAEPSKYDHAEYGTYCKVVVGESFDLYRQTSDREDEPKWEHVGFFHSTDELTFLH